MFVRSISVRKYLTAPWFGRSCIGTKGEVVCWNIGRPQCLYYQATSMLIDHWSHTTINRFRFDLDEGIIAPVYGRYILRVRAITLRRGALFCYRSPTQHSYALPVQSFYDSQYSKNAMLTDNRSRLGRSTSQDVFTPTLACYTYLSVGRVVEAHDKRSVKSHVPRRR